MEHLTIDGEPDRRYKENRTYGYNADGSKDMRCRENRVYGFNKDGSRDMRCSINRIQGFNKDGSRDMRFSINKLYNELPPSSPSPPSQIQLSLSSSTTTTSSPHKKEESVLQERVRKAENAFSTKRAEIKNTVLKEKESSLESRVKQAFTDAKDKLDGNAFDEHATTIMENNTVLNEVVKDIVSTKVSNVTPNIPSMFEHKNVIIVGKTGCGKSTLLNAILKMEDGSEGAAETGIGRPVTQGKPKEYVSGMLRVWDTKGIEVNGYGVDDVVSDVKEVVDQMALKNDPNVCIHAIWYCVLTQGNRLEDVEKEALLKFMNMYDRGKLPVIVVLTQAYSKKDAEAMEIEIKKIVDEKKKKEDVHIVSVVAKAKEMDEFVIKPRGTDHLLSVTDECAKVAAIPACRHFVRMQVGSEVEEEYGDDFCAKMVGEGNKKNRGENVWGCGPEKVAQQKNCSRKRCFQPYSVCLDWER